MYLSQVEDIILFAKVKTSLYLYTAPCPSNATILGRITIGRDATVGGNIWVTENVPAGARIVQTKAKK